ncbi:MAG: PilZ domain-containing protein [Elusimicrobiales bacterium]|jgi:hypothetical protein
MPGREKRRAPRQKHDSVLELCDGSGNFISTVGHLVDFSTAGVCFSSTQVLNTGDLIRGRLRLLKEGLMYISGRVIWSRRKLNTNLYGIRFDYIKGVRPGAWDKGGQ